jgi:PAS domain S-box-containing protein
MNHSRKNIRLGIFLNVGIGIVFIIAALIVVITVNYSMHQQALIEARSKARIIIDRNLATHTYFSRIMKPSIFAWSEPFRTKEYFDHTWMSSTYAIREIEKYFKSFNPAGYSFKDSAINARSPENEADEYERAFIEKLNTDKKLESESTVRNIDGKSYLIVLRKGEVMEASCLQCHSNPKAAPKGLTDYYGSERSFHRKAGDAVSAVSLRIPLSEAYGAANVFSLELSAILLVVLACLFTTQYWFYRRYLLEPLNVMRDKANQIATHEGHLGEQIPQPFGRELRELTATFNEMSAKLRYHRDHLEKLIDTRTEALRVSEDRWRDLFTRSKNAIAIYEATDEGQDFIIRDLNPAGERIEGVKREEIVGRRLTEAFPGVEAFGLLAVFRRVWKTAVPESHDACLYLDERISGWRDNSVYRLPSGEIAAVYDDITARKKAEEELSKSVKRYRDLYDFLPIPVYEMDFEANITSANRAIYETFRGTEEDFKGGFKAWQLLSPEEVDKSARNIQRLLKGEKIGGTEYTLKRLDGSAFPAIVISSVTYSNGKPVGLIGAIIDITERRQAEEELKESKALIEAVVENVPLMIFLKEATDLRFVVFNRAGEELLGYDRRDLIGKNNLDLFPPEQAAHFMANDRQVLEGDTGILDIPEEPILTARKGQRLLHTRKVCIRGSDGVTKFLLGISDDITDRKRAEEDLKDTMEKLRKSLRGTIEAISFTVEIRDPYTAGHQKRVSNLARVIAQEIGLPKETIDNIRLASSIHDIGKISVPAEILLKPGKISGIEMSLIKLHAQSGYDILKDVELPYPMAEIVLQHHERLDGSGYPRGLKDGQILLESQIVSVADVVEAMASHRPYRPSLGIDAALEEIEKNKGILYHAEVVDACLRLFREKGFQLEGG